MLEVCAGCAIGRHHGPTVTQHHHIMGKEGEQREEQSVAALQRKLGEITQKQFVDLLAKVDELAVLLRGAPPAHRGASARFAVRSPRPRP